MKSKSVAILQDFQADLPDDRRSERLNTRRQLLVRFMAEAPFQPATNFWRAIELPELAAMLPRSGRGLDVGCGDGVLSALLCELVEARWELVGVDPDAAETQLARASTTFRTVHTTGADHVPEAAGSFDFAFANSVLEHIPDLAPVLAEVARCLKPGGLFAATVPSAALHSLMHGPSLLRRQTRAQYLAETDRRLAHFHYPTIDQWKKMLSAAGLELKQVRGYLTGRQVRRWEAWANRTGGLLYRLRGGKQRPIEIQRSLKLRRSLPSAVKFLGHPAAWVTGYGVIDDDGTNPAETGCLVFTARKRG